MRLGRALAVGALGAYVAACRAVEFTYADALVDGGVLPSSDGDASVGGGSWVGPGKLLDAAANRRDCPSGYVVALDGNAAPAPVTCSACACGEPDFGVCESMKLGFYASDGCPGGPTETVTVVPNSCAVVQTNRRVKWSDCKRATCAPSAAVVDASVTWKEGQRLCLPQGSGLPSTPDETGHGECIWHAGDIACPADSRYRAKYTTYSGFEDHRGCSECHCVPASCGTASVIVYGGSQCGSAYATVDLECGECSTGKLLDNKDGVRWVDTSGRNPCVPTGGDPIGEIRPTSPTTVCCAS